MAELSDDPRIPAAFTRRLHDLYGKQFDAMGSCIEVAAKALELPRRDNLQRVARSLVASMTNSMTAVGVLCRYGHGADAIRIARRMFEVLVTLRYLMEERDWSADRIRGERGERHGTDCAKWVTSNGRGVDRGIRAFLGSDWGHEQAAVRRKRDRSRNSCRCGGAAGNGCPSGVLDSSP